MGGCYCTLAFAGVFSGNPHRDPYTAERSQSKQLSIYYHQPSLEGLYATTPLIATPPTPPLRPVHMPAGSIHAGPLLRGVALGDRNVQLLYYCPPPLWLSAISCLWAPPPQSPCACLRRPGTPRPADHQDGWEATWGLGGSYPSAVYSSPTCSRPRHISYTWTKTSVTLVPVLWDKQGLNHLFATCAKIGNL